MSYAMPVRQLRLVLLLLIVKNVTGFNLRPNIYQVQPNYEDYLDDDDGGLLVVIVINDVDTHKFDENFKSRKNKGLSIDLKTQDLKKVVVKNVTSKLWVTTEEDSVENDKGYRDFDGLKLTPQQKTMLRKRWQSSCDKKAAKTCIKACTNAVKNSCRAYHCKSGLKRNLKKSCKSSCKTTFLGLKYVVKSDSD